MSRLHDEIPQGLYAESDSPGSLRHSVQSALYRLYDFCHPALRVLRSNRLIIRGLFGVRIPRRMHVQFDPTTILPDHVLRKVADDDDHTCLEVGIGQAALISLSVALRRPIDVVGVDCSTARVAQSRRIAQANAVAADFFTSDLFSAVPPDRRFDLIFFNPPYVPTRKLAAACI